MAEESNNSQEKIEENGYHLATAKSCVLVGVVSLLMIAVFWCVDQSKIENIWIMQKLGFTLTVCYLITNAWFTHLMHQIGISADDKRKKARKAKARTNKSCQIAGKYHLLPRRNPQFAKVWNDFSLLQFCSFGNAEKWKRVFGLHLIISQLKGCMRTTTNKILKLVDGGIRCTTLQLHDHIKTSLGLHLSQKSA